MPAFNHQRKGKAHAYSTTLTMVPENPNPQESHQTANGNWLNYQKNPKNFLQSNTM